MSTNEKLIDRARQAISTKIASGTDKDIASVASAIRNRANRTQGVTSSSPAYKLSTGSKQYTLSQDQVNWVRQAHKASWKDAYAYDDEDQRRKASGLVPRSYAKYYTNSKLDNWLLDNELPSAKYLDRYLEQYGEYESEKSAAQYQAERIGQLYDTVSRKLASYEAKGIANDNKEYDDGNGNLVAGSELWSRAFYDSLDSDDWADVRQLYSFNTAKVYDPDDFDTHEDYREAVLKQSLKDSKEADATAPWRYIEQPSFSYADFSDYWTKNRKTYMGMKAIDNAIDAARIGGSTYEDVRNYNAKVSLTEEIGGLSSGKQTKEYAETRYKNGESATDILASMRDAGAKSSRIRQAKNRLYSLASSTDEKDAIMSLFDKYQKEDDDHLLDALAENLPMIFTAGAQVAATKSMEHAAVTHDAESFGNAVSDMKDNSAVRAAVAQAAAVKSAEAQRRKDNASLVKEAVVSPIINGTTSSISVDGAKDVIQKYIDYNDDGTPTKDSMQAARAALADDGASEYVIKTAETELGLHKAEQSFEIGRFLAAGFSSGGLTSQSTIAISQIERANQTGIGQAIQADKAEQVQLARQRIVVDEGIMSPYEYDQAVRTVGYGDVLDPAESAYNYFVEVDIPRIYGDSITVEQASAAWSAWSEEERRNYIADFDLYRMANPHVAKSPMEVLRYQGVGAILNKFVIGTAKSVVNLGDMAINGILGRSGDTFEFTKEFNDAANYIMSYGSSNQSAFTRGVSIGSDIGSEVLRMYAMNALGGAVAGAVSKTGAGTAMSNYALSSVAATSGITQKGIVALSKTGMYLARSSPFMLSAAGSYYAEAIDGGATVDQATSYALVNGSIEGLVEAFNADKIWGRALGGKKTAVNVFKSRNTFAQAGYVTKMKGINLIASFLGEYGEEAASYASSWLMSSKIQGWNQEDFSLKELNRQGVLGGVVGLLGGSLSLGSINANNIMAENAQAIAEYMTNSGDYSTENYDVLFSNIFASSLSDADLKAYAAQGTDAIMNREDYHSSVTNVVNSARQLRDAQENRPERLAEIGRRRKSANARVSYYHRQLNNAVDDLNAYSKVASKLYEANAEKEAADTKYAADMAAYEKAYAETEAQLNSALSAANAKLAAHHVNIAMMFSDKVDAMQAAVASSTQVSDSMNKHIRATYSVDNLILQGTADPASYDAAVLEQGMAAKKIDEAKAAVSIAGASSISADDRMAAARAGKLKEFQERQAEQETGAFSAVPQENISYVEMDDTRKQAIVSFAQQRFGRNVVIENMANDNVRGYYENGTIYLNSKQLPVDSNDLLNSPEGIVLKHELTHFLESGASYARLSQFVFRYARDVDGVSDTAIASFKADIRAQREALGQEYTDDIGNREFVALFAQDNLLRNEAAIKFLVREQSGIAGRVLNWAQYQIAKIKATREGAGVGEMLLLDIERMYTKAFAEAGKRPSDGFREYMYLGEQGIAQARQQGLNLDTFRGLEGKLRAWVSDSGASINGDVLASTDESGSIKLRDILNHEALFKLYPQLSNMPVRVFSNVRGTELNENDYACYNPKTQTIDINANTLLSDTAYDSTGEPMDDISRCAVILHEVQHVIQSFESIGAAESVEQATVVVFNNCVRDAVASNGYSSLKNSEKISLVVSLFNDKMNVLDENFYDPAYVRYVKSLSETEAFQTEDAFLDTAPDSVSAAAEAEAEASMPENIDAVKAELDAWLRSVGQHGVDKFLSPDYTPRKGSNLEAIQNVIIPIGTANGTNTTFRMRQQGNAVHQVGYGTTNAEKSAVSENAGGSRQSSAGTEGAGIAPEQGAYSFRQYAHGMTWNDLVQKYGAHEQGKDPRVRDIDVPLSTDGSNATSKVLRSVLESKHLTDAQVATIQSMTLDEGFGAYIPKSNASLREQAKRFIAAKGGVSSAQDKFVSDVDSGKLVSDLDITTGMQLLAEASQRNDFESVVDIVSSLCLAGTRSGRAVQAFTMLKELGGVGSYFYMQKLVDSINQKYDNQIAKGKMNSLAIPQELVQPLLDAKTHAEVADAEAAVTKYIGANIPLTLAERLSNWRYFAMLANPVTHFRNMLGNTLMAGMRGAKNAVATGFEHMLVKDQAQRVHAVYSQANQTERLAVAEQSFLDHKNDLVSGGKYGFEQMARDAKRLAKSDLINALEQFNFNALEVEDLWFMRSAYIDAYTQYMIAQGIDAKSITKEQDTAAAQWASDEALRATFRDASKVANVINQLANTGSKARRHADAASVAGKIFVEGIMPFKKTPINIAKRGIEYSPVGLIMGAVDLVRSAKSGDPANVANSIDKLASGTVGSALWALGMLMAKLGVLRGNGEEQEGYEQFLSDTGEQTYSLNIGDVSINLASVAPATIPLFMGVALYDAARADADGSDWFSSVLDSIFSIADPMMEMSFLSSINSALKTYDENSIGGVLKNVGTSYVGQYLPTIGSKLAKAIDPIDRTTKGSSASPLGWADQKVRSYMAKIPGVENTLEPYVTVTGETRTQNSFGAWALDFANQFIFPGKVTVKNRDAVDEALIDLYESTGNVQIFPTLPNKYFKISTQPRYDMTASEYTDYCISRGNASYAAIKALMSSARYARMSDEERAEAIGDAITKAEATVSNEYKERFGLFG